MVDCQRNTTTTRQQDNLGLSFPTLSVDGSIASLDLTFHPSSSTMRPAPPSRTPSEAASSTLEDSTYDLVSNQDLSESGVLSDDDARTESLASFDGNTPDDLSVINSADESEEEDALNTPLDSVMLGSVYSQHSAVSAEESAVNVVPRIDNSGYTSHTVRPEPSLSYLDFYVDDLESCGPNHVNLVHTVQSADEPNCNDELEIYEAKCVGVDLHMTVSSYPPPPRDVFRVLIMGYYTHSNNDIADHIKEALHSVLPKDRANAQISLVMHHCIAGNFGRDKREIILSVDRPTPLDVTLRGGKAFVGKDTYPLWDLAIFLHTSLANIPTYEIPRLERTFEMARLGMRSSGIPIMDLSMYHPLYRAVPHVYTCDRKSLHLRVTTRKTLHARELPCEMLPVDLDKFFAIDPLSLGKHLACITEVDPAKTRTSLKRKRSALYDTVYNSIPSAISNTYRDAKKFTAPVITRTRQHLRHFENFQWVDILLAVFVTVVAVTLCTVVPSYLSSAQSSLESRIPPVPPRTQAPQEINWADMIAQRFSSALSEKPAADILATPSTKTAVVQTQTAQKEAATEAKSSKGEKQSKRDAQLDEELKLVGAAFEQWSVEVVDACTVILSPRALTPYIRYSGVRFGVHQNGQKIYGVLKTISDKGFIIDVGEEHAHEAFTLRVRGHYQLPRLGQVPFDYSFPLQISSSSSKTSFEAVRDMVAQEFILVQNNAMELSARMTTGLQHYMDEIQQQTVALREQAMQRVHDTKKSLANLSPGEGRHSAEWKAKREQLRQLRKTKKALQKQGKELSNQVEATLRAVQDVAQHQYDDTMKVIRSLRRWRCDTAWPVRVSDWEPRTAFKRGLGNAQGLIRKLQDGSKVSDSPKEQKERRQCNGRRKGRGRK